MRKISLLLVLFIAFQVVAQDNIEVINIENRAVQDYMADAEKTYTANSDYQVSVITKYNNTVKYGKKLYWPQGKLVKWTPSPSTTIEKIIITASENPDYSDAYTFNPDNKTASSYEIRNLLPNRIYYYKVEEFLTDGSVEEKAHGLFRTKGQVRMIQVRGCSNVRDLGGWETQYGPRVRYGIMFRSGNLDHITSKGIHDFCENLNVRAELDLRKEAASRTKSPMGADKEYLCIPHGGYLGAIKKRGSNYLQDLKWINERLEDGVSVDWHCAIGCDRCGTLTFLIEGLLGLSELDLCRDYELSTFIFSKKNKRARGSIASMISYIKKCGSPDDDLKTCFYKYWLSIGAKKKDLDYLIHTMLGDDVVIPTIEIEDVTTTHTH